MCIRDRAVTTDIGDSTNIHPKDKQDVGKRLAAIALHNVYGENNVYSGPMYQSMKVDGNKIRISFTHLGSGLMVKDKYGYCLLYTSPSPRDRQKSRMPS